MVLCKRKPISLPEPLPLPQALDIDVWHISETGEWFVKYKNYLERMDFYNKHNFSCEITGASCLTFFEALDSEETQFKYVEEKFPIKLREPIAKFLHFNAIKRLDGLVEAVYSRFKNDFFPGEIVYLRKGKVTSSSSTSTTPQPDETESNQSQSVQYQKPYIVKEKSEFNATIDPKTSEIISPAYTKYMVIEYTNNQVDSHHYTKSFIADQSQLYRDRTTFTKHLIKCFCKITLVRATSKMGAPWCVKEEYLPIYGLTMEWPQEMLMYREDPEEPPKKRKHNNAANGENEQEDSNLIVIDEEDVMAVNENLDNNEDEDQSKSKKKKRKAAAEEHESTTKNNNNSGPITMIVDDFELPFQGPTSFFKNLLHFDDSLELINDFSKDIKPFKNFDKLLITFQFLNTFSDKLNLSEFNFEQFITSLKSTDPIELKGEVVYIDFIKNPKKEEDIKESSDNIKIENTSSDEEEEEDDNSSNWKRNPEIRKLITSRNSEQIKYSIEHDNPASDEILESVNNNGTGLLIECFVAILRLFIDENGDWTTVVTEEWIEEEVPTELETLTKNESPKFNNDASEDSNLKFENGENKVVQAGEIKVENLESDFYTSTDDLDKYLNYRNVNWAERLANRQFNNHLWLLTLLGVLQDSMHIPTYKAISQNFTNKVIPKEATSAQIPRFMWRNFCTNLTMQEKIDVLWVIVDIVCNFSPDIKNAIEENMDLCNHIRSEKYRISKELKSEQQNLLYLQGHINNLASGIQDTETKDKIEELTAFQEKLINQVKLTETLSDDKQYFEKQLLANDHQRLKPLGLDRYGNTYYWLELNGIPIKNLPQLQNDDGETVASEVEDCNYHCGRVLVRGPSEDILRLHLGITDEELESWKRIKEERGRAAATYEVFKIGLAEDNSYFHDDGSVKTEIVSKDGVPNSLISLNPIQRKIIDETPERLLMEDSQWLCFENSEDVSEFIKWLDTWGRREHNLLRVIKPMESSIEHSFKIRKGFFDRSLTEESMAKLLDTMKEYELTDEELNLDKTVFPELSGDADQDDPQEEEAELEATVDEIMKLDDKVKTKQILQKIKELETHRDELLEKIQKKYNAERPNARTHKRSDRKRIRASRENKIKKQAEILTDLINLPHFKAMEDVIGWKNDIAIQRWGVQLRKNASGNKKIETNESVDQKMQKLMNYATTKQPTSSEPTAA